MPNSCSSSSSRIKSSIQEILKINGAEGISRNKLVQLVLGDSDDANAKRKKTEKVLTKLVSKGAIREAENGLCITNVEVDCAKKESKKRKSKASLVTDETDHGVAARKKAKIAPACSRTVLKLPFDCRYILAPMVGASELPFRLLCRKYGATLAYTPMMSSKQFAVDEAYRKKEFQTIPEDRPLVAHFSANDPKELAESAKLVEPFCDAIDLNLGCPQRTAYLGNFGSYLLDPKDRNLLIRIVSETARSVQIPIFCKIRLLDTVEDTIQLCRDLRNAGASLIAIHARYRATWERTGPGARDGPALLDQVAEIKQVLTDIPIIANGNIVTFDDCERNLELTKADGVMSAEGLLDNPALFFPRYRKDVEKRNKTEHSQLDDKQLIEVHMPSEIKSATPMLSPDDSLSNANKHHRKLLKKLREIDRMEELAKCRALNNDEKEKLSKKESLQNEIKILQNNLPNCVQSTSRKVVLKSSSVPLGDLYKSSENKLTLAQEYLALVREFPTTVRTVIFHIRRMCRDILNKYQLMEECVSCETIEGVESIISKCLLYDKDPTTFYFNAEKQKNEREALEKKKIEEGKRKAFESRMIRKAKRERLVDVEFYLRQGSKIPSLEFVYELKKLPREKQLELWKKDHSQHCLSYHLNPKGCDRNRSCAFLHMDPIGVNAFNETEEVAG